jgi:hypothetical protein
MRYLNKKLVKLQDGSTVLASTLLSGDAQDDEGNPLRFEQVQGAPFPTWSTTKQMGDGSGRTKVYSFGLENTNVRVSVSIITPEQQKQQQTEAATRRAEESKLAKQSQSTTTTTPTTEKAFKTTSLTNTADEEERQTTTSSSKQQKSGKVTKS